MGVYTEKCRAASEEMTGWSLAGAIGRPANDILKLRDERVAASAPDPVGGCLAERRQVVLEDDLVLSRDDGTETSIRCTASPVVTKDGGEAGGAPEKLAAARSEGCDVIVVARPDDGAETTFDAVETLVAATVAATVGSMTAPG